MAISLKKSDGWVLIAEKSGRMVNGVGQTVMLLLSEKNQTTGEPLTTLDESPLYPCQDVGFNYSNQIALFASTESDTDQLVYFTPE